MDGTSYPVYPHNPPGLRFSWARGRLLSFARLLLHYFWDLAAGAFIAVCFAAAPLGLLRLIPE